jgi:hypothetical protein
MTEIKETPHRMVADGQVAEYGKFTDPFREVNLLDVDLEMRGRKVPRTVKDFRLKEWEHFGIITDDYYFGMVIFDAKFMGTSFFYAYNRQNGYFFEHERTSVGGPVRVARELWHGECYFRHFGYSMEFENRLDSGLHRLRVEIKGKKNKPPVSAEIYVLEDIEKYQPLVTVSPVSDNRPLYTHKAASPVEGRVMLGDKEIKLDPAKDIGLMDVQKTFYPYRTFWNWATFGCLRPAHRDERLRELHHLRRRIQRELHLGGRPDNAARRRAVRVQQGRPHEAVARKDFGRWPGPHVQARGRASGEG